MPEKPFHLAIGIPAYNEEKNIGNLLTSLLGQVGTNFIIDQIIVISDHSDDQTNTIVQTFSDPRILFLAGEERLGQNLRQNQIVKLMPAAAQGLLLLEADTLPTNHSFIQNLVSRIPPDGRFSLITSEHRPAGHNSMIGQVTSYGYRMKHDLFENAISYPNLYLSGAGLLSREFLATFEWDNAHHEDSYCFRAALRSGLPIIRGQTAILEFRTAQNLRDYFLQSGKFRQAMALESKTSDIYELKFNRCKAFWIIIKYFFLSPVWFILYLMLAATSKLYYTCLPSYHPFWTIYTSTKKL
jgi:glycosyltransferase involved in cell wall biosynthesis